MPMKIPDPKKQREAREAVHMKAITGMRQGDKISDAIAKAKLPKGMSWMDGSVQLDRDKGGHQGSWVSYLVAPAPPTPAAFVEYYVKPVRFGWLTESSDRKHILERIEAAVHDFQKEIAAGIAKRVKDGEIIPDDCAFKEHSNG